MSESRAKKISGKTLSGEITASHGNKKTSRKCIRPPSPVGLSWGIKAAEEKKSQGNAVRMKRRKEKKVGKTGPRVTMKMVLKTVWPVTPSLVEGKKRKLLPALRKQEAKERKTSRRKRERGSTK